LPQARKQGISAKSNYRGAAKERHRRETKTIVTQQKKGIVVKSKVSWQFKRFSPPF
jgi:hypothetical protein